MNHVLAAQNADLVSSQAARRIGGPHPAGKPEHTSFVADHRGRTRPPLRLVFVGLQDYLVLRELRRNAPEAILDPRHHPRELTFDAEANSASAKYKHGTHQQCDGHISS
jgi:hypothetical protein